MKVDVAKLANEAERKKREQRGTEREREDARLDRASTNAQTFCSPVVEGRVLVAAIIEPAVLELCGDLEVDDFSDLRHRTLFAAARNLQAIGWPVSTENVVRWLQRDDERNGQRKAEKCEPHLLALVLEHAWNTYGEPKQPVRAWVEHDLRKLRALAHERRKL